MPWAAEYRAKVTTPEAAVRAVRSGDRVYLSGNAATPFAMMRALADRAGELQGVAIYHVLLLGTTASPLADVSPNFRHVSFFVGPADRAAVNDGSADYVPIFLHQIPSLFTSGAVPLDVAILHTTPPDEHGFLSLGVEVVNSKAAAASARIIIAQVNPRMPRTLGDCFIHVSQVQHVVEVDDPIPELQNEPAGPVEEAIGAHIAELVEDGSTLQLGIGGIPDAVLAALRTKRDLGIHSEMLSDGVMQGIERGYITGSRKTLHRGKVVATFVLGSRRLYDFVHDNPIVELHPVEYSNDPFVIARNDRMVAVNSAIEVDLTGQVCADSIGTQIYSGFGGQLDFIRGSAASPGGLPIIALPSTARDSTVSRIVPTLRPGAGVVTTRGDVHHIVTEYGVAALHGRSLRERMRALIAVAHPAFRGGLEEEAARLFHWYQRSPRPAEVAGRGREEVGNGAGRARRRRDAGNVHRGS